MLPSELLALFRSEMSDEVEPYLWSDDQVYGYMVDAQRMFCRKTDGIGDGSTAAVVQLQVEPGTDWVNLHPSILAIRNAVRADTGAPIERLNDEDLAQRGLRFDGREGAVCRLILGLEENKARVHPISNETVTLNLLVFRLPLSNREIDLEDVDNADDFPFEIGGQHHRHLLLWVKSLAYGKQDAETFDRIKQREYEQQFLVYCADVKNEQARKRHKPRAVAYGGL